MKRGPLVLIFVYLSVTLVSGRYWSEWTAWSECSRTCDGGAKYQTRNCHRGRVHKSRCHGKGIRYTTCNNKPCLHDAPDFRAEQCAAYNDASYSGRFFRWLPHHNPSDPCSLSCIAEGTNTVAILAPKVLDGTRCDKANLDMCINGKCIKVGCDHELGSKLKFDSCGICGGNDKCMKDPTRSIKIQYRWIETGYGACSRTCGTGVKEKKLLCFDTSKGKIVDTLYCKNLVRPPELRTSCSMGTCPPEWRVGPWQNCTHDCGGGVSWRIVTCVQTYEDGTQQLVRDRLCPNLKPSSRKSCNGFICPRWYAGQWSVCSVSCGTGTQKRDVVCRHIGDTFCRDTDKPRIIKNCTTGIPCYNLNDHRYVGRRIIGDVQERNIGEFSTGLDISNQPQGDQAITKEDLYQPRFVTTTWDTCSATCGEGIKFRYVRCQVFLRYLNDFVDLPDQDCLENEEKPDEYGPCMLEPCYDEYEWVSVGMTECSRTCLGGIQETILKCVHKENKTEVSDDYCVEANLIQTERRICNDRPCPQRWELGKFGECSSSCGGGNKTRTVKCIQEYAQGSKPLNLPDFMCSQPVPNRTTTCNTVDCPAFWVVGNWSKCSVTCGFGVISRRPYCQRVRGGKLVNVSRTNCDIDLKPDTEMTCNMTQCPDPMIKTKNVKFFQLEKMKRVKLIVGMSASILPDTTVIVKCPNVGLDRQKITWFKNGYKFRRSKRARVARSGALRIKSARPDVDKGVYSCLVGGLEANVSVTFSSSFDVLQAAIIRNSYLKSGASTHIDTLMNGTYLHMDPVDRKKKPLYLLSTEWSRCSVTCGGGLQSRNMSCEIITRNYYEILPTQYCLKHLATKPLLIQSCNTNPCVRWASETWSTCSEEECVRNQFSIQRRPVHCLIEFNSSITEDRECSDLGFPPDNVRDCFNPNCTAMWNTSDWSECMAECGEKGSRYRMLTCVWSNTGKLAPQGSCDILERPKTTRKCKGPPCPGQGPTSCEDESEYCSVIKLMSMCHHSNFGDRCCRTCSEDYYDEYDTEIIDNATETDNNNVDDDYDDIEEDFDNDINEANSS